MKTIRHLFLLAMPLLTAMANANTAITPDGSQSFITNARQTAKQMYPGWNLGNTMEAIGGETSWQGTKTTQQLIDCVKSQGFKSVRIPCSWDIHCNADGRIDTDWMQRVKEIVDYCINDSLYVVLNDHWDGGWMEVRGFSKTTSRYEVVDEDTIMAKTARLKDLWTQIATTFRDYDDHLLLAGLNEPFQQYDLFSTHHKELTPILQRYNQAFVEAVRATGGNNATRCLVVQAPSTNVSSATDADIDFQMPTDPSGEGKLMVEVHYYDPWEFCGQETDGKWFWGEANHVGDGQHDCTWGEEEHVKAQMQKLYNRFVKNGVPVIIGENGVVWRQLPAHQQEHDASVKSWFKCLNTMAASCGCVTMLWDINVANQQGERGTHTVIDRATLSIFCTPALEGIREGVAAAVWPY